MRLVQKFELLSERATRSRAVVVGSLDEHNRGGCPADSGEKPFTDFGRTFPGIGGSREGDRSAYGAVAFCCKQRELATERMPSHRDMVGFDSRHSFKKE